MSYTVKYQQTNEAEKQAAALKDCKEWLGAKQFNKVTKILKADNGASSRHMIRLGLAMVGIQGYPAEAMIDKYWTSQKEMF